jgi:uncharacterized RDD family membrane protein YckC
VAHVCPHCGAANRPATFWCVFCRAPLRAEAPSATPRAGARTAPAQHARPALSVMTQPVEAPEAAPSAEVAPSSEPQWRRELSRKVEAYRERTGTGAPKEPQSSLPFPEQPAAPAARPAPARQPKPRPTERQGHERLQIFVDQHGLDFPAGTIPSPNHALVPVAGLARRAYAWCIDIGFLVACWGMFLGLLAALGVEIATSRLALGICLAILFLLYAQYFGLFSAFGGITPGMRIAGLRVVSFDGNPPTPKQLLWRSLGYFVAGGAVLLGFLWALWDDDRLSWQDRVSQTYLTSLPPLPDHSPAEEPR